jgi:hypothetical protein
MLGEGAVLTYLCGCTRQVLPADDDDVQAERERVLRGAARPDSHPLLVAQLRQQYTARAPVLRCGLPACTQWSLLLCCCKHLRG